MRDGSCLTHARTSVSFRRLTPAMLCCHALLYDPHRRAETYALSLESDLACHGSTVPPSSFAVPAYLTAGAVAAAAASAGAETCALSLKSDPGHVMAALYHHFSFAIPAVLTAAADAGADAAAGAETCALSLKSDLGMSWQDAAAALQEAADLAQQRGEEPSPHK